MAAIEAQVPRSGAAAVTEPARRPRVLHSHHYGVLLQRAIQEADRVDAAELISRAAAEAVYQHLVELPDWDEAPGAESRLREVTELFRASGLGVLDVAGVTEEGGEAVVSGSHFGWAWLRQMGSAQQPVCGAVTGFVWGALAATFDRSYAVEEVACVATGAPACRFRIVAVETPVDLAEPRVQMVQPGIALPQSPNPGAHLEEAVAALLGGPPVAAGDGHIRALGHELTHLWADYYNKLCYRFEQEIPRVMGSKFANLPGIVLTEVGHLYGFHCFGSILASEPWRERVLPRLSSREDWAHVLASLISALGWGGWRIHGLVPGERLTVRVHDGYEAEGYLRELGPSRQPRCYLARGTAAALMNLLYVGDPSCAAELSESHYNQIFRSPISFRAVETRCRAMGDPYCELVVNPLSPTLSKRSRGEQLTQWSIGSR